MHPFTHPRKKLLPCLASTIPSQSASAKFIILSTSLFLYFCFPSLFLSRLIGWAFNHIYL
ncbi:hypothetical protein BDV29DRAFT_170252 [Aspergillus leporis]|uniref:Uncharacterized protein n=1 Tax=Aspergillus leporis TaxID=41062 RepID=A0A5N5X8A9_9EURO|nr:hypothetical protein BDV29DRAFT_170252 [Aspergillus leporis]